VDYFAECGDFEAVRVGICVGFGLHSVDGDDDDVLDGFGGGWGLNGPRGFYSERLARGETRVEGGCG
jgi:hypothetical protein